MEPTNSRKEAFIGNWKMHNRMWMDHSSVAPAWMPASLLPSFVRGLVS
jgi:hypothetical protein